MELAGQTIEDLVVTTQFFQLLHQQVEGEELEFLYLPLPEVLEEVKIIV